MTELINYFYSLMMQIWQLIMSHWLFAYFLLLSIVSVIIRLVTVSKGD